MKRKVLVIVNLVVIMLLILSSGSYAFYSRNVPVTGMSMNKPDLLLGAGCTGTLDVDITPDNATNVKLAWSSSNKAIAAVDSNGSVKGVKAGKATVTVKTSDGKFKASCAVTVTAKLAPVKLVYDCFLWGQTKDMTMVNDAINKMLTKKINATIKINNIPIGEYPQKMAIINSSHEYYDLCFTSPGWNNYYQLITQNVLRDITNLLPRYAPNLWKMIPANIWDAARVNKKIYAAINYQIITVWPAWAFNLGFDNMVSQLTGYKVEPSKYKKYEDLEPFLAAIKKANIPQSTPFSPNDPTVYSPSYYNMDIIGTASSPGWVRLDDKTLKVINQYESPEMVSYYKLMRKWYNLGYMLPDIATLTDLTTVGIKFIGTYMTQDKPGTDEQWTASLGYPVHAEPIRTPVVTTSNTIATMTGITTQSKNPERAAMFLDLMSSDEDLFNLWIFGIEGKHYTRVGAKTVDLPKGAKTWADVGYSQRGNGWAYGNQFLEWLLPTDPPTVWKDTEKLNATADVSPLIGFNFDPEPVKTEMANCDAVLNELHKVLYTGTVDPDVYLPKMIDKLKVAGSDKIIAEKQKQINAWKAGK